MSAPFKGDLPYDMAFMHAKYGVHKWINDNQDNPELLKKFFSSLKKHHNRAKNSYSRRYQKRSIPECLKSGIRS